MLIKLTKIIKQLNPDILICIGNRAIRLTLRSSKGNIPIVGVAQNHKNKKFENCDAVFCITNQLVHIMHQKGIPDSRVFHVPNMVAKLGNTDRTELRNPPVIGAFGRFVDKKGFRTYIKALDILKTDGVMFKAILGGDGVLKNKLQEQIRSSGLEDEVTFTGWVKDKSKFFNSIDLYILPSRHEPFGIVLIEAMCESVPCISTKSEGPIEIITDGIDGLLFSIDDEEELALAMKKVLIQQPSQCKKIGSAGFRTIENKYTMNIVSKILEDSAYQVIQDF